MSDMLDNILSQNILNLTLDEAFLPPRPQFKAPGPRLNRSASYFSSSSPPHSSASSHHSLSTEHVNNEEEGGSIWPSDIWSQVATSKYHKQPFRPDRSMSLTESSSALFSSSSLLKGVDPSSSSSSLAPPPGFPPLSAVQNQTPMTILPSNRYKTELCRGFQENGVCKYGSKCQFAHGVDELRGLYRHPKYKTEPCRTFYNFGYCPYGPRCHFIHENKVGDGPAAGGKFPTQRQQAGANAAGQNPRHPLRQSVSFAGFVGSSNSPPPPSLPPSAFNDLNLGFSRAPSVSPPPADLLSPPFGDSVQREATAAAAAAATAALQFHGQSRASAGDIHNIPIIMEPKASCCRCCHRNSFPALNSNNNNRVLAVMEDSHHQEDVGLFTAPPSHGGYVKAPGLQRFSSEDSLEDSYSSCSGGSSGSESPTFDGSASKRLTVFARLSLSD